MIDISKIYVYDNLFPEYLVSSFSKKLNNTKRWEYGIQGRPGGPKDGRFFSIWLHRPHESFILKYAMNENQVDPFSKDVDGIGSYVHDAFVSCALPSMIPDAKVSQIYRVHFNGQVPMNVPIPIHYDWEMPDYWTMVYYVGGKDGDTLFYDEPVGPDGEDNSFKEVHRVKFKPGRLIFFPSYYWHAALHPTEGLRTSFAISYVLGECGVNNELRKMRGILDLPPPELPEKFLRR